MIPKSRHGYSAKIVVKQIVLPSESIETQRDFCKLPAEMERNRLLMRDGVVEGTIFGVELILKGHSL